jgi:hypothetical protein
MSEIIENLIVNGLTLKELSGEALIKLYKETEVTKALFTAIQNEVLRRISA